MERFRLGSCPRGLSLLLKYTLNSIRVGREACCNYGNGDFIFHRFIGFINGYTVNSFHIGMSVCRNDFHNIVDFYGRRHLRCIDIHQYSRCAFNV